MVNVTILIENFSIGGAQNMVYNLVKNLDRHRVNPSIICYRGKTDTALEKKVSEICQTVFLDIKGRPSLKDILRILRKINEFKPDVVHGHLSGQTYAILYSLIKKVPCIVTAHTRPNMAFESKTLPILKHLLKVNKACIVAVSDENNRLCKSFFGIKELPCITINNGVDIDKFFKVDHQGVVFINVARQDNNKNQSLLIVAMEQVLKKNPDTRMILLGDGPCHPKLKDEIIQKGLSEYIKIPGAVSDVENYYAISDIYVQPSLREAMPMTALEAMAAGLPIIAKNVGGMKDIIKGNGVLVDPDDDNSFITEMLNYSILNKEAISSLGNISKSIVEHYSASEMAEKYTVLYEKMIKVKSL